MGEDAQSPAAAYRRKHSTCAGGGWRAAEALWSQHISTRSRSSDASIGCTLSSRLRRRDASLPTFAARGSAVVVRRACGRHGRISGSEHPHGAQTPGAPFARTPRGSKGSRSRTVRRCRPASGNADSCRAGRSQAPRAAPSPPPRQHWTAAGAARHNRLAKPPPKALSIEGPGFDANQTARAFVYLLSPSQA